MRHVSLILLSFVVGSACAFHWKQDVDFNFCLGVVNSSNISRADYVVTLFNPATGLMMNANKNRTLLTLLGCEDLCHSGFELWPAKDILGRVILWVIPALILLAHFRFAPLSATNTVRVILHLIGDPIDSMWSLLTRQEANKRHLRRITNAGRHEGTVPTKEIAVIWIAYDEFAWTDASWYFYKAHQNRCRARLTILEAQANPELMTIIEMDKFQGDFIRTAAQRIRSIRTESQLTTYVAIFGLFAALGGAFIRTWSNRLNNQTSHTIAAVTLFLIFIPLVKLSSDIGAATSATAILEILLDLRRSLRNYELSQMTEYEEQIRAIIPGEGFQTPTDRPLGPMFPPIVLSGKLQWNRTDMDLEERTMSEDDTLSTWPDIAAYAGMNSSWRPKKSLNPSTIPTDNPIARRRSSADREPWVFLVCSVVIVTICYGCALCLSFYTPLVGFACRSLCWTLILTCWLLSPLADWAIRSLAKTADRVWTCTSIKDLFITLWVIAIVIIVQIGLLNSCWCRSGALTGKTGNENYINLYPLTDEQWDDGWALWLATPAVAVVLIAAVFFGITAGDSEAMKKDQDIGNTWRRRHALDAGRRSMAESRGLLASQGGASGSTSAGRSRASGSRERPILAERESNDSPVLQPGYALGELPPRPLPIPRVVVT